MSLNQDEIIQIVAKEFDILLTKDDPILAVLAVHDVVLKSYTTEVTKNIEQTRNRLELFTSDYQNQIKSLTQDLIKEGYTLQEKIKDLLEQDRQNSQIKNRRINIAFWIAITLTSVASIAAVVAIVLIKILGICS
ncbi:hypothetical protein [Candidatus Nitrosacidococcus tergens]|uniref:Conjugal transfer protein TraM n=1 Tax=Candidatus Nitrosacidococcus tergens TaxID=553981 RepID=A0A7G1Q962_9GAMM|nr:hypothetical protein [Candidatus Nitrosacidococcus tergens]CAB1275623.1 protein of unknown function [Candidatus Nitrosacidococcus tergens]